MKITIELIKGLTATAVGTFLTIGAGLGVLLKKMFDKTKK